MKLFMFCHSIPRVIIINKGGECEISFSLWQKHYAFFQAGLPLWCQVLHWEGDVTMDDVWWRKWGTL